MAAPAPTQQQTAQGGAIDNRDVEEWKSRFNDVLAKPSEHINSKSPESSQPWHAQLFGCFNPIDLCLITCFVPCVTFGKTHHRMRKDANLAGYEPINTSCLMLCATGCVGLSCIPVAMQRADQRQKYGLQGDCISDLLISCCCGCCSVIQSEKEAEYRELNSSAAGQKQYQATDGMAYPAAAPAQQ